MVVDNLYTLGKIVNDRCEYKEMAAINHLSSIELDTRQNILILPIPTNSIIQ